MHVRPLAAVLAFALLPNPILAQDAPGPASALSRAAASVANRQPAIPRPEQEAAAAEKLAAFEARAGQTPNIVIFIVDDMGYGDPGAFGGGAAIGAATPAMDALAAEGLRLTSTYAQYTCTPTRAAVYTGRLPVRTGLIRPILAGDQITTNPWEGELTVAGLLSDAGYHTMLVGKWHIGEAEGMRPHDVGFDEFYGFYKAQKEYTQAYDERRFPDLVLDQDKAGALSGHRVEQRSDLRAGRRHHRNDRDHHSPEQMAEGDPKLRDYTIRRIGELAEGDKPFFISHSFMKVHADNFPSEAFRGASASKFPYKDNMVEVDAHIGDIVDAWRRWASWTTPSSS